MTNNNTVVLIDAGYLSKISLNIGEGKYIKIDINQFAITLAKSNELWCKRVYYYTAPPYQSPSPTLNEIEKRKNHDRFVNKLKNIGIVVREGRCQKGKNELGKDEYHQKGVDTLITMDLMDLCKKKEVETIIALTCDTDFVPILNKMREEFNIKIILAYYTDRIRHSKFSMSNHILTACDKEFLLTKEHFEKSIYLKKEKPKE